MSDSSSATGGIGFTGALALLFIGLKLANVITWSWLWVLSPLWLPLAVILSVILVVWLVQLPARTLRYFKGRSRFNKLLKS